MIRKVDSKDVPLTPELAKQFATMRAMPGERPLKPSRLEFHRRNLRDHRFNSPTWHIAVLKSGEDFRCDGDHTSTVLSTCSQELFPNNMLVTVIRWEIDSLEVDGVALFDMFDNPASSRGEVDKMTFYRATHPDLNGVGAAFLLCISKGIKSHNQLVLRPLDYVTKLVSGLLACELPLDGNPVAIHTTIPGPSLLAQASDVSDSAFA